MARRRFVHREDAERLQPARTVQRLDDDARAFIGGLIAIAPQARYVQQHIRPAIVGNDEAKTLGHVEPLDGADDFDDVERSASSSGDRMAIVRDEAGLVAIGWKFGRHAPKRLFATLPCRKQGTRR